MSRGFNKIKGELRKAHWRENHVETARTIVTDQVNFNLTPDRLTYAQTGEAGSISLTINPGVNQRAEDAVIKWAREIGMKATPGPLTITGTKDQHEQFIERLKKNDSLKGVTPTVAMSKLHAAAGVAAPEQSHGESEETRRAAPPAADVMPR